MVTNARKTQKDIENSRSGGFAHSINLWVLLPKSGGF